MDTARRAAPEIDRLVLSVNAAMSARHGQRLLSRAEEAGLGNLYLLPHLGNFMLAGNLTPQIALARMRYAPPEMVSSRLDELEGKGFLIPGDTGLGASPELSVVLEAVNETVADAAGETWADHEDDVAEASAAAELVGDAATDEHEVAVAHRMAPEPADPFLRLHQRLVTLRFIRQHEHANSWLAEGLAAADMVVMTPLWNEEEVEAPTPRLIELGYVDERLLRLTEAGREVRQRIEDSTNRGSQWVFDVLDEEAANRFLSALARLPGVAP